MKNKPTDGYALIGKTIAGRYEILQEIGSGGMGVVYKANQIYMKKVMALKIIRKEFIRDKDFLTRFMREAQNASAVDHKNAVRIYDFGEAEDGIFYLTMEYIDGESLSALLKRPEYKKGVPLEIVLEIIKQTCAALSMIHQIGIVHRDLKPDNIILYEGSDGYIYVKVLDFGISRAVEGTQLTQSGVFIGTPQFMSPEQGMGKTLDKRSDIYSLGVIIYAMLAGRLPFISESAMGYVSQHNYQTPPSIKEFNPNISSDVEAVVMKTLEKKPEKRYQTVDALIDDLESAILKEIPKLAKKRTERKTEVSGVKAEDLKTEPGFYEAETYVIGETHNQKFEDKGKPASTEPASGSKKKRSSGSGMLAKAGIAIAALLAAIFFLVGGWPEEKMGFNELFLLAEADFKDFQYDSCIEAAEAALLLENDPTKTARLREMLETAKIQDRIQKSVMQAKAELKNGEYEKSLETISHAHSFARDNADVQKFKKKVEAIKSLQNASASSKSFDEWAALHSAADDPDVQAEYLHKLLEIAPDNVSVLRILAYYYLGKREYEKALQLFDKIDPDYSMHYLGKIDVYSAQEKYRDAQAEANKILKDINKKNKEYQCIIRMNTGRIYQAQRLYKNARKEFIRAINLDPENPGAYQLLGGLYFEEKDYDKAIIAYEKALELPGQAENVALHNSLANTYSEMGPEYWEKARSKYRRTLELAPNDPSTLNSYAYALGVHNEHLEEAVRLMRNALKMHQYDRDLMFYYLDSIGWIYFKQGKNDLALRRIKRSASFANFDNAGIYYPLSEEYWHLGEIFTKSGNKQLAMECYNLAIDLDTERGDVAQKVRELKAKLVEEM